MRISNRPNHFGDRQTFRSWCHIKVTCPNHWLLLVEVPDVNFEVFVPLLLFSKGLVVSSVCKLPSEVSECTFRRSPALTTYVPTR